MIDMSQWENGPNCSECGNPTFKISESELVQLLGLQGIPDEIRQQANNAAVQCNNCKEVICNKCAFETGKSLGLNRVACSNMSKYKCNLFSGLEANHIYRTNTTSYSIVLFAWSL